MVAAKIANLRIGANQHSEGLPIGRASEMMNVSERSVARAKEVLDEGVPELADVVERGQVSVSAAANVAQLPGSEQREIVAACPKAVVEVARDIRTNGMAHRTNFSGNNEWYTPGKFIALAREVLGRIDLDPASHEVAQETVKAARFFTQEDDGLSQKWSGRVWLNPPYSQPYIGMFVDKFVSEFLSGNVSEGILLTNNSSDTRWFHHAISASRRICFTRNRISFTSSGGIGGAPVQGQTFFYISPNVEKFEEVFSRIGAVVEPKTGGSP